MTDANDKAGKTADQKAGGKSLAPWLLAAAVIAAGVGGYFIYKKQVDKMPPVSGGGEAAQILQVRLVADNDIPDFAPGYIKAPIVTATDAKSMVGMILGRAKGADAWDNRDIRFIPRDMRFIIDDVSPNERPLFRGYVSAKASIGGKPLAGAASWSAEDVAELTLKNVHAFVYDAAHIPMADLQNVTVGQNREALFVRQVNVTEISARRFQKRAGTGEVKGPQVQINGSVYVHQNEEISRQIVSFQPIEMPAPKDVAADAPSEVKTAVQNVKKGAASPAQKVVLADYLTKRAETTLIREKGITAIRFTTGVLSTGSATSGAVQEPRETQSKRITPDR